MIKMTYLSLSSTDWPSSVAAAGCLVGPSTATESVSLLAGLLVLLLLLAAAFVPLAIATLALVLFELLTDAEDDVLTLLLTICAAAGAPDSALPINEAALLELLFGDMMPVFSI